MKKIVIIILLFMMPSIVSAQVFQKLVDEGSHLVEKGVINSDISALESAIMRFEDALRYADKNNMSQDTIKKLISTLETSRIVLKRMSRGQEISSLRFSRYGFVDFNAIIAPEPSFSDYLTEIESLYNQKEYGQALEKLEKLNKAKRLEDGNLATLYWYQAMCYAHIGELLMSTQGNSYSEHKGHWKGLAEYYIDSYSRICRKNSFNIRDTNYVFETIGKKYYHDGMILYDNKYYRDAEKYADNARKQFERIRNAEWRDKSIGLANKSRQKYMSMNLPPETDISNDIKDTIPEKSSNTYVFCLDNPGHAEDDKGILYCNGCGYYRFDVKLFKECCSKTLGIPNDNIMVFKGNTVENCLSAIRETASRRGGQINVILYYYGLAYLDENDNNVKLVLGDTVHTTISGGSHYGWQKTIGDHVAMNLDYLFDELGKIPTLHTICLINALRRIEESILQPMSARIKGADENDNNKKKAGAVRIKPNDDYARTVKEISQGNIIVILSSEIFWNEISLSYSPDLEFAYYLMKKLQQTRGDVSLGELYDYLYRNVRRVSFLGTGEFQTPTVITSTKMKDKWRGIKL